MQLVIRLVTAAAALIFTIAILAAAGIAAGYYYLEPGLPSADTIRDVKLQTPLRIYSRDGRLMAQVGEQRRTPVGFADIPDIVVKAFLAAEDDRFFEHPGFDYQGIIRAGFNYLVTGERSQGGSTITQQLARAYFLTPERSFVRKAKELILAVRIEREFTKSEILSLYLNKIFLGQRAYGVAAAAEVYFGKPLAELDLAEAATIAGIPKAPSQLNPVSGPLRANQRRGYVLRRMYDLDYINKEQYQAALATPLVARLHGPRVELDAPYVTEMVRAEMVERFGPAAYTDGYSVVTTVDSHLQQAANTALATALFEYDRRHGYRGPVEKNVFARLSSAPGPARDQALQAVLEGQPGDEDLRPAVVLGLNADNSARFYVRDLGEVAVSWDGLKWRRYLSDNGQGPLPKAAAELLAVGDIVHLLHTSNRGWLLAQTPQVEGAIVALDPRDGATVALAGGYNFFDSSYNRAVQAKRQPGSSFKPFIYSAGLEHGFSPATLINDAPLVFGDGELEDVWRPENYAREFNGPTRMREALVQSLNLVSVRILMGTGIEQAINHIKAFGFDTTALPRNLSLALGSGGASPWDMAAGYSVFANGGRRVEHYVIDSVLDASGRAVFRASPLRACDDCIQVPAGTGEPAEGAATTFAVDSAELREGVALDGTVALGSGGDEVPPYAGADEMIAHGESWRPTPDETPGFFRGTRLAPRVISPENAYLVYDMMRDVIKRGTGRRARELGRADIAGKTGTSNDRRDAWFSGFNGALVATVWVGFDQERSLGAREEGGATALPMWKYFMARALRRTPDASLAQPSTLIAARISPDTGQLAAADEADAVFELFRPADLDASGQVTGPGGVILQADQGTDISDRWSGFSRDTAVGSAAEAAPTLTLERFVLPRRNRSRPDHRRTAIAQEAARIIQEHGLKDFRVAKEKAGVRLGLEDRGALPSNREIESALAERNRIFHGDSHDELIGMLREAALTTMRLLAPFDPRLVGPVLTGNATEHSSIELHVFSDSPEAVGAALDELGLPHRGYDQRLRMRRDEPELFPAFRFRNGGFAFAVTVFPERGRGNAPLSAVDGRPMRRATARDVEALLAPAADAGEETSAPP